MTRPLPRCEPQPSGPPARLVGLIVKLTDDDPQPESTVWFTVDDILVIREFNAVDEVLKAYEAAER